MTQEFEVRLVELCNRVALHYGEDMGQEIAIRMILNPELDDPQLMQKAKWLSRNTAKRESRCIPVDFEFAEEVMEIRVWAHYGFEERMFARIELRRLCEKSKRIVKLVKVELGLCTVSRQRESYVRAVNRNKERKLL
ncbi:hypothetical protein LCGC14_1891980 [marine sediment metagenome]|uniref:Uncharacterized protein n=1 Tax=marine sediment metagenome TaxID=412755 RepID=A0A0F9ID02_9ZZZZ